MGVLTGLPARISSRAFSKSLALFETQYSDEEFDDYVINLFKEVSPGDNFIIGMGDNLPFDGEIERLGRIAELIDKHGHLPIRI